MNKPLNEICDGEIALKYGRAMRANINSVQLALLDTLVDEIRGLRADQSIARLDVALERLEKATDALLSAVLKMKAAAESLAASAAAVTVIPGGEG